MIVLSYLAFFANNFFSCYSFVVLFYNELAAAPLASRGSILKDIRNGRKIA